MFYSRNPKSRFLDLDKRYRITLLVFISNIVSQLAIDLYTPSFPAMRDYFATSAQNIELTLTFYMLGYGIWQLLFGYLADKIGRRKTLMLSYIGFLLATLFIIRSNTIHTIFVWRFIQGAMGAGFQVCMRTTYRDLFKGTELTKVSGIFSAVWALIPVCAPTVGGYIEEYFNWQMQFKVILFIGALFALLFWLLVPETKNAAAESEGQHFLRALKQHLQNQPLLSFSTLVALSVIPMMAYVTMAPFLFHTVFDIGPVTFGWLALLIAFFNMLGAIWASSIVSRWGNQKLLLTTITGTLSGNILFIVFILIWPHQIWAILIPNMIIFFATGALYPASAGMAYAAIKRNAGVGSAIYGTLLVLFAAAGMATIAILPHDSALSLALLDIVVMFFIIGMYCFCRKFFKNQ